MGKAEENREWPRINANKIRMKRIKAEENLYGWTGWEKGKYCFWGGYKDDCFVEKYLLVGVFLDSRLRGNDDGGGCFGMKIYILGRCEPHHLQGEVMGLLFMLIVEVV